MSKKSQACAKKTVEVNRAELPLSCPQGEQMVWNAHPKVYLPIEKHGNAVCPYCSTRYELVDE